MSPRSNQTALQTAPEPLWIREMSARKSATPFPFAAAIQRGEFRVSVPVYARLSVERSLFGWERVHDGQSWNSQGIFVAAPDLDFSFPLASRVRVDAHGKSWTIELHPSSPLAPRRREKNARALFFSVIAHLAIFGLLLAVAQVGKMASRVLSKEESAASRAAAQKAAPEPAPGGYAGGGQPIARPFEGISYADFLKRLEQNRPPVDKLNALLHSLGQFDFKAKPGAGKGPATGLQSAVGTLSGPGAGGNGTSMTAAIQSQKFNVQASAKPGSSAITDAQRALLREKFKECQDDFKRLYSKLLAEDPSLSVTVGFDARVTPEGYLSVVNFKARGTFVPAVLSKLQAGMADIIRAVYVGKELSGVTMHGENIFVR